MFSNMDKLFTICHSPLRCWVFVFALLLKIYHGIDAFNLDTEFSIFFKSPNNQNISYFGYAVDIYASSAEAWVIVGAPLSNTTGEVYRCKYNSSSTLSECDIIQINQAFSYTSKQMLGATIALGPNKNLLSCAPQFTNKFVQESIVFYDFIGMCYLSEVFTDKDPTTYYYKPCINDHGKEHYGDKHSFCQAGFSAEYTKDMSKILLGAVGSYYSQGGLMVMGSDSAHNVTTLPLHTAEVTPVIPGDWKYDKFDYYRRTYDVNYLGYSVATGTTVSNLPLLVTSAPRRFGYDMLGWIEVYDINLKYPLANLTGQQAGEYFGHGLAVLDLNGDNLDDIVAGSPLFSDYAYNQPEVGRIYVFYQQSEVDRTSSERRINFSEPTIIPGNYSMGRFGHAIASLGDVNGDEYQDFIVSAPYETSKKHGASEDEKYGALYVFNGGKDGIFTTPSQVIHGADLEGTGSLEKGSIRGLGFSLKGGRDVDGNGYPDVAAGAFMSDHAVLIRSRPVVKLTVESKIKPNKVDLESKVCDLPPDSKSACYSVDSCFSYQGKNLPPSAKISYSYDVDSVMREDDKRSYLLDPSVKNLTLTAGRKSCVNVTVYVKEDIRDKLSPIAVTISYWLQETHQPVEPVLDQLSNTSHTTQADIYKSCGPDDICVPELDLQAKLNPTTAVIGAYTDVVLTSYVKNDAENAYQTKLVVAYPEYASFDGAEENNAIAPVIDCVNINNTVACEVGNPLTEEVELKLKFGIHGLKGDVPKLFFELKVNCTNEQKYETEPIQIAVTVDVEANIRIYNISAPEVVQLDELTNKAANSTGLKSTWHSYEITNMGPSDLSSATISLLWPLKLDNGELLLGLDDVEVSDGLNCQFQSIVNETKQLSENIRVPSEVTSSDKQGTVTTYYNCKTESKYCHQIKCLVEEMRPKSVVTLTLKGLLYLAPILSSGNNTVVTSSLVFEITAYPYAIHSGSGDIFSSEVSTYAVYPATDSSSVQWWIIFIAVAAGVLFLLLIILILWKCGFFKRKILPTNDDRDQQQRLCHDEHKAGDE